MRQALIFLILALATPIADAAESIPGVTSHYRVVEVADGSRLQSIVSLPDGASTPRHPLLWEASTSEAQDSNTQGQLRFP